MPRCLYCLNNEENRTFRSVEHVFPESLGNTSIILEKGVVCDQCNNGILSQLDKTLLDFDPVALLRVNYFIWLHLFLRWKIIWSIIRASLAFNDLRNTRCICRTFHSESNFT